MDRLPEAPEMLEPNVEPLRQALRRQADIHPSALVAAKAVIEPGAVIGPWCQVGPDVVIERGARLHSHVVVDGHTRIGAEAELYPFCTVGLAPQDLKYRGEPTECEIGPRTHVREHCTIHRGTVTGAGVTRVGADCLVMAVAHVAHDCQIGSNVIIANNVVMGGHVHIADQAVIGGAAAIHQFVRIGRGVIISGATGVGGDVVPFGTVIGNRGRLVGLNVIGLRRRGFGGPTVHKLRAVFRSLFRDEGIFAERLAETRARYGEDALVREIMAFIDAPTHRGLIRASLRWDGEDAVA
jgi:UDP-N-acetylglucosamine acyltransferase